MDSGEYPEALQIEVTNRCNFNCRMCIRRVWDARPADLNLALYKKIAASAFPRLKKLILYGFGEPLLNASLLDMLKISMENLPKDSEILVSTNGSLLSPKLSEKLLKYGVNNISLSIDTNDLVKLRYIREGSEPKSLIKNFQHLAKIRSKKASFKLGLEAVVMKTNLLDIPSLIEEAAYRGVDYILVSHVVPYTEEILQETAYLTISGGMLEMAKTSIGYGRRLILEAIYESLSYIYGINTKLEASKIIEDLWHKAEKSGYWINLPLLFESVDKVTLSKEVEKVFDLSRKIAWEHGVNLILPSIYPDARSRKCPYVDRNTIFVRSDGAVSPCMEFAYRHMVYVNTHAKNIEPIIFGFLSKESIGEIWSRKEYSDFREVRRRMPENIPWCGDCLYSSAKCFFTQTNEMDCYLNKPGCSECLYSVNISQCNI
jgi:MoaA/NifB/PqqE/SkfB family radical SAM enzyme